MKSLLLSLCLLLSFGALAEEPKYQIKGSLGATPDDKNKNIDFTLTWSEKDGKLIGTYEDTYYSPRIPIRGITGPLGRIIVIPLPEVSKGIKSISFLGSDLRAPKSATKIFLGAVIRDERGNPVRSRTVEGSLSVLPSPAALKSEPAPPTVAQRQEEAPCRDGFGLLAGYCGDYTGMITEEEDDKKKCDLLKSSNAHLIFEDSAELSLVLGTPNAVVENPTHRIGRVRVNPENTDVDVMSRSCRPLEGTTFKGDNCKRLALIGSFTQNENTRHFTGTYTIVDENTNESCRYSLSMDQGI